MENVSSDWDCYYDKCEVCGASYHASERECSKCYSDPRWSKMPHLAESGYTFDRYDGEWHKLVSRSEHVARRDHADGSVLCGQRYFKVTIRYIDDNTGKSHHDHSKRVAA